MFWSRILSSLTRAILAFLGITGFVAGQDFKGYESSPGASHRLSDKEERRNRSNTEFVNAPVVVRIPERFEMYDPRSEEEIDQLKAMGFTQVILDRPNLHAAATQAGLKVVLANWWINKTQPEKIENDIDWARKVAPNSLIGFSVMDEPERNSPETPFDYYVDLYKKLKPEFRREFPGTKIEISHWGPLAGWDESDYKKFSTLYAAADVMRIMPYPDLHEAALDDVFFMIQRSRKLMKTADRDLPLVVILQAWILQPDNKLPEIDELRVMAWQAMLSGAEVVSFFEYNLEIWQKTPGFTNQFKKLMAELTAFSRKYRDRQVVSTMSKSGVLTSVLTSHTGERHRVEVNTRRTDSLTLAALEVRTTVLLPHRQTELPVASPPEVGRGSRQPITHRCAYCRPRTLECRQIRPCKVICRPTCRTRHNVQRHLK